MLSVIYKNMGCSIFTVIFVSFFACHDRAVAIDGYHSLVASDIVLRGSVESVELQSIDRDEYIRFYRDFPEGHTPFFVNIQLNSARALRGAAFSNETVSTAIPVSGRLVGEEVMLCADWKAGLMRYVVHTGRFVFVRQGSGPWISLEGEVVDVAEAEDAIERTRPSHLFDQAVVVVEGTVTGIRDHRENVIGETDPVTLRRFTLGELKVLKGGGFDNTLSFETLEQGNFFRLQNYGHLPRNLGGGQRLLVFLGYDAANDFLYPLCGVNGLYRVMGDELIIGDEARLSASRKVFEATAKGGE
jgi:hypothetical protein